LLLKDILRRASQSSLSDSIQRGKNALLRDIVSKYLSGSFAYRKALEEDPNVISEASSLTLVDTTLVLSEIPTLRWQQHSEQATKYFVGITRSGRFIVIDGPYEPETSDALILLEQLKLNSPLSLEQGFPIWKMKIGALVVTRFFLMRKRCSQNSLDEFRQHWWQGERSRNSAVGVAAFFFFLTQVRRLLCLSAALVACIFSFRPSCKGTLNCLEKRQTSQVSSQSSATVGLTR